MARIAALCFIGCVSLLFSSPARALPQSPACRAGGPAGRLLALDSLLRVLVQDPWQDCDEDPWQLSAVPGRVDTLLDPWQDDVDPWQPVLSTSTPALVTDGTIDPWQPVVGALTKLAVPVLDDTEDPWQPSVIDPWQDGTDDPWQLP